jgi:hypothetical protein
MILTYVKEDFDGSAVSALGVRSLKLSNVQLMLMVSHRIGEQNQRSQWSYIGWVTASEGTLSRWSRLHLQSLAPTPVSRRVDVRQAGGRKNNCRFFITT